MIARELLVQLGFNIDESKFNRFSQNVDNLKAKLASIKTSIGLNVDTSKISEKISAVKEGINSAVREGMSIDAQNLKSINEQIGTTKAQMKQLRQQINQRMYPEIDTKSIAAYRKELAALTQEQRKEVLALNKIEQQAARDQIRSDRAKYAQLQLLQEKLGQTQKSAQDAAKRVKASSMAFSQFFTRFSLIGVGSGLLALRNTLKDAQNFKAGKTNNYFSSEQLAKVHKFNVSLMQLKKTLQELRNKFVINLLPAFKENIEALNDWFKINRELINAKVSDFVSTLAGTFKILASALQTAFTILSPFVNLIGGWGTILNGLIGIGILSWLLRLSSSLKSAMLAVQAFAGVIRVLSIALISNPIIASITAIVAALALIADEFIVTANGGDSLINRFEALKKIADGFVQTLKEMWHWLTKVGQDMFDFKFKGMDIIKLPFFGRDKQQKAETTPTASLMRQTLMPNTKFSYQAPGGTSAVSANSYATNYMNSLREEKSFKTTNNDIDIKNNFNISIAVPKGTSEEQSRAIATEVRKQVQDEIEFNTQKMLNAIGPI